MSSDQFFHPSDVPNQVIESIADHLHRYSTPLIKLGVNREGGETVNQIGSGTFVSIGTHFGILTAQHVSRELDGECALGFAMIDSEHNFHIEKDYLRIIEVGSANVPSDGPDLSLIILPAPKLADIKAVKSFYNLDYYRERVLVNPPPIDAGLWFIAGAPGELTTQGKSEVGRGITISYHGFAYNTYAHREYTNGEFDYIEVDSRYGAESGIPLNLGGMSGGGLWQVTMRKLQDGHLEPIDLVLSGTIFYQSAPSDEHRFIRCHGRRSIYRSLYRKVEE